MKINEVAIIPQTYIATVRVVTGNSSTAARTSVTADSLLQARAILSRLYGVGNVFSVSEVMRESPRSCQVQRQDVFSTPATHRQHPSKKTGPVQLSCVSETGGTKTLSASELQVKSLADQAKRLNQQASVKKAQTKLAKAQQDLMKASRGPSAS